MTYDVPSYVINPCKPWPGTKNSGTETRKKVITRGTLARVTQRSVNYSELNGNFPPKQVREINRGRLTWFNTAER